MRLGACAAMIKNDAAPADVTERTTTSHEAFARRSVTSPSRMGLEEPEATRVNLTCQGRPEESEQKHLPMKRELVLYLPRFTAVDPY